LSLGRLQAVGTAADTAAARVMDRLLGLSIRCGQQTHACMSGEGLRERALGALGATGGGGDNDELSYSAAEQKVITAGWVTTKEVALLLGELFRCVPLRDAVRANASAAAAMEPTPPLDMSPSQHVDKKYRKAATTVVDTCAPLLTAAHFRRAGDYLLSTMLVMKHNGAATLLVTLCGQPDETESLHATMNRLLKTAVVCRLEPQVRWRRRASDSHCSPSNYWFRGTPSSRRCRRAGCSSCWTPCAPPGAA